VALPDPESDDVASLRAWVDEFSRHVAACEFDEASRQYDPGVLSFSSYQDVVVGIDEFVTQQWRQVWPTMTDFRLETESMHAIVSSDRCMGVVALTWASTGYEEDRTPFDRPGRCTIVLLRDRVDGDWRGVHGHFSLKRGVPQQSFGPAAA
jgi:ketosteroid isomerase-like protein